MKLRVIDLETSGRPEDRANGKQVGICEIGWTDVSDTLEVSHPISLIVNPGHPMPPEARAVHHLSDEDVAAGIKPDTAYLTLSGGMEPGDIYVAHNAAFERAFFTGGAFPWICTMQCAKHLWEDAPGYSNQTLRYWLGVDSEFERPDLAMPPHRAGPDTYVTAYILTRMLLMKSPADLVELTNTPVYPKIVGFGNKWKGAQWTDVDEGYLEWIIHKSDLNQETKDTARYYLGKARSKGAII